MYVLKHINQEKYLWWEEEERGGDGWCLDVQNVDDIDHATPVDEPDQTKFHLAVNYGPTLTVSCINLSDYYSVEFYRIPKRWVGLLE